MIEPTNAHNIAITDTDVVPKPANTRDQHRYCDIGTQLSEQLLARPLDQQLQATKIINKVMNVGGISIEPRNKGS
jgi:hypothetical protein